MTACASTSLWLAPNPSKRWGELFFLLYSPFWLTLCLGIVIPFNLYEKFTELEYLLIGLVSAVPTFLIPMLLVGKADRSVSWKDRYWIKACVFLGASYTFPSWKMNNVPHTTFLLTHVCFLFYHVASNMTLRRLRHFITDFPEKIQWATEAAWILALAYFIAYLETLAISNVFEISLASSRIDEKPGDKWDLPRVAVDALGAAMLVTIILDLWRIFLGPVVLIPDTKQCAQVGLPWFTGHANLT
ncbi:hypothetical protein Fmac_001030 [Flemingia macrophylla]|uniref:Cycloeucalenol cycloisomerase n=1 Tax=Flemingia macrophylla TaxID=520843 RepID=A0ABD1NIQ9_9FABA